MCCQNVANAIPEIQILKMFWADVRPDVGIRTPNKQFRPPPFKERPRFLTIRLAILRPRPISRTLLSRAHTLVYSNFGPANTICEHSKSSQVRIEELPYFDPVLIQVVWISTNELYQGLIEGSGIILWKHKNDM